ncbi:MAG: hypothetical protein KAS40_02415, partial [Desulfobacterales bacterium]|nr:hypothetical protein [Desulfobacterales bacterium]
MRNLCGKGFADPDACKDHNQKRWADSDQGLFKQPILGYIVVVKKTFRYSNVFFYNPLCRNSVIR